MNSTSQQLSLTLPALTLHGPDGRLLQSGISIADPNPAIESGFTVIAAFSPDTDGTYYLNAGSDAAGETGDYLLFSRALSAPEDFQLAAVEDGDAAASISTSYTIGTNEGFLGGIDPAGDTDWVGIDLEADQSYLFALVGFLDESTIDSLEETLGFDLDDVEIPGVDPNFSDTGDDGDDDLEGSDGVDAIAGLGGDDEIEGLDGADRLNGGAGNDLLNGEAVDEDFDPTAAQVFRIYEATLDRAPDQSGHYHWIEQLQNGTSLQNVVSGFVDSTEFQNTYGDTSNTDFVTLLYNNVLDRAPDAAGLADWTGRLGSGALTRSEVVLGFSESPEFIADTKGAALAYSHAGYQAEWSDEVFRIYQATLDRTPDQAGFLDWSGRLAGGTALQSVVDGFVDSAEFQNTYGATSNEDFVTLLYDNVLNRDADAAGLADWTGRLEDGILTRSQVVMRFSEADEFKAQTSDALNNWMLDLGEDDRLEGGAGNDTLFGGVLSDRFVFTQGDGGSDQVAGLESWDRLEFEGFGYDDAADALSHMTQVGSDVVFADQGMTITFHNTARAEIDADMFLFS